MTDRLARLVKDGEVGEARAQPRGSGLLRAGQDSAAFRLADGFDDRRAEFDILPGDHANAVGERTRRLLANGVSQPVISAARAVDEDGLPDLQLIAGLEDGVVG